MSRRIGCEPRALCDVDAVGAGRRLFQGCPCGPVRVRVRTKADVKAVEALVDVKLEPEGR